MAGRGLRPFAEKKDCILIDHSGVVDEHGFVDDPVDWTLDDREKAWIKKIVRKKEAHIFTCDNCLNMFTGRICPRCGTEVKNYGKKILATNDELKQVKGEPKKKHTMEEKALFYAMAVSYGKNKGYKPGWAAWTYRIKFRVWPRAMKEITPVQPDGKFLAYIKYLNIRKAKAREKNKWAENS